MNLDATPIAIRERGFTELLDLALRVIQSHAGPLALALLAGVAPWALVNLLLLGRFAWEEDVFRDTGTYLGWLVVLCSLEAPLATAPVTLYLGQATFSPRIDARRIARDYARSLPQMLLLQGVGRAATWPLVVTAVLPYVSWPFLSELILLERNPLRGGRARRLTTLRRSRNLHAGSGAESFVRWVASLLVGAALLASLLGAAYWALRQFFNYEMTEPVLLVVALPVAVWLVVGYFAVVRFLAYLDRRIRREGWEVELKLRAEGARLAEAPA